MKLMTGMVLSSVKAPDTYNEITRMYIENEKRMVEVSQFSKDEEDRIIVFFEKDLIWGLKRGIVYVANNWASRN